MKAFVPQRGFTLVETLVVLVVMSLLAATVVLTWPTGGALRTEASALAARATLAAQESVVSGVPMGLDVTDSGYVFYRMESGAWREVDDERAFRRHAWREGAVPRLQRDGLDARNRRLADASGPTIVFDPTGLVPTFSVTLAEKGARFIVASTAGGIVEMTEAQNE